VMVCLAGGRRIHGWHSSRFFVKLERFQRFG